MHFKYTNNINDILNVIDIDRVYEHLRLVDPGSGDVPVDADLVKTYLGIAVDYVESYTAIPCCPKIVEMHYDSADQPYGFLLRFATSEEKPTSIKYMDESNVLQTIPVTDAYIETARIPNQLVFKNDITGYKSIRVKYDVTAVTAPMVPGGLIGAIILYTAHLYDNRAIGDTKASSGSFITTLNTILNPYRTKWHQ
jgi:hypothetical protein